jgi:hypothetical protein
MNTSDKIFNSIKAINPSAEFLINNDDLTTITWLNGTTPISKADIEAKMIEVQSEYDAQEYARKRKSEYPTIEELVVALYDSEDRAAIDEKRAAVKLKHPKGV